MNTLYQRIVNISGTSEPASVYVYQAPSHDVMRGSCYIRVTRDQLAEIEAELLAENEAELLAENARLTAQVEAADTLYNIALAIVGNTPRTLLPEPELEAAIAAYDAATAPANAGQQEPGPLDVQDASLHWVRINNHERRINTTDKRLDELAARVEAFEGQYKGWLNRVYVELGLIEGPPLREQVLTVVDTDFPDLERTVESLAARVQQAEGVARMSRDYVPKHTRRMDQMQREIDNLRTALEAARHPQQTPQPTPSAPVVVTDAMTTILQDWIEKEHGWIEKKYILRDVLKRVFAARDAEEDGR